jgi:hypothetical protein
MTAARQERKSCRRGVILMALSAAVVGLCSGVAAFGAVTGERVVINRHTGLAIDGFDPVAYFVDAAPEVGRAEFELRAEGAIWRFCNTGNRAAFAANPEIYAPRFGGHDPVALSRGVATSGNPRLWLIAGDRLYLFYSDEARDAFAADSDNAIAAAERNWPQVQRTLVP